MTHNWRSGIPLADAMTVLAEHNHKFGSRSAVQPDHLLAAVYAGAARHMPVDDCRVTQCKADNTIVWIDCVFPATELAVRPGDIVAGGFRISHSFSATHNTELSTYVLRLVCANGLTIPDPNASQFIATDANILETVELRAATMALNFSSMLHRIADLQEQAVKNVAQFISRLLAKAAIPGPTEQVLAAFEREPDRTRYGVLNALTYVTSHATAAEIDFAARQALNNVAATLLTSQLGSHSESPIPIQQGERDATRFANRRVHRA